MRKKIIIIMGVMILSVIMFGCSSDTLKIPKSLELKDEYKKSVNEKFAENFINSTSHAIKMYENIDTVTKEDIEKANNLSGILLDSKSGSDITESEMILSQKVIKVNGDILFYSLGTSTEKAKIELKENVKILLDLYK